MYNLLTERHIRIAKKSSLSLFRFRIIIRKAGLSLRGAVKTKDNKWPFIHKKKTKKYFTHCIM